MTIENSRADALTDEQIEDLAEEFDDGANVGWKFSERALLAFARAILAASPGNQPAAASTMKLLGETRENGVVWFDQNPHAFPIGTKFYAASDEQPAPSPADERAAFRAVLEAFMVTYRCKGWEGDWAYQEAERLLSSARPASAKETGAEGAAVPAGWKLVPIEPTVSMLVDGFESWPDPIFSTPEEWGEFEKMTGCQQATHKARLCYSAMLAAAPQPAQADARVGLTDAVVDAAKAVVREALDSVSVHPCDEHDDEVRARQLPDYMQKLYRALLAARTGASS